MGQALWEALYALGGWSFYHPHFTDEATEVLKGHTVNSEAEVLLSILNLSILVPEATEQYRLEYHALNTQL